MYSLYTLFKMRYIDRSWKKWENYHFFFWRLRLKMFPFMLFLLKAGSKIFSSAVCGNIPVNIYFRKICNSTFCWQNFPKIFQGLFGFFFLEKLAEHKYNVTIDLFQTSRVCLLFWKCFCNRQLCRCQLLTC